LPNLSEYQMRSLDKLPQNTLNSFSRIQKIIKRFEEWFLKTHGYPYKNKSLFWMKYLQRNSPWFPKRLSNSLTAFHYDYGYSLYGDT
jgi:hypothetical protein